MANRFLTLFKSPADLYAPGAPVILAAGALQQDTQTSGLFIQLKFKSISALSILSLKVKIQLKDDVGSPLGDAAEIIYLDLHAAREEEFGAKKPIVVSNKQTRAFSALVSEVHFIDGSVWQSDGQQPQPLAPAVALNTKYTDVQRAGFEDRFGKTATYVPQALPGTDLWRCTCGQICHTGEATCSRCKAALADMQAVTAEGLTDLGTYRQACDQMAAGDLAGYEAALKKLETIKGYRDAPEHIETCRAAIARFQAEAEQARRDAAARSKKRKKRFAIIASCAAACLVLMILTFTVFVPAARRHTVNKCIAAGDYEAAVAKALDMKNQSERIVCLNDICAATNGHITIPDGVTSIGVGAFYECTGLTSVTIPNSVTSIGEWAFYKCTSLTSVTIPDSVTSIGAWAFSGCTGLTNITIPNSVTSIGNYAFEGCMNLTSVTIPDSVTYIGYDTFNDCTNIQTATMPTTAIKYIPKDNLQTVVLTSGKSIDSSAFRDCTKLTSITIPDSVTSIGNDAFEGCTGLTSITIPDSVTYIGYDTFSGCTNIQTATMPTTAIEYIPKDNLQTVVLTSGKSIDSSAFRDCTKLTSITIPDSVTYIGDTAFSGCTNIQTATMPTTAIEYIPKDNLQTVVLTSGKSIDSSAFYDCTKLTSITIPDSVTSIGEYAFNGCTGLTNVIVGNGVTSIDQYAFLGCTGLTNITIPDSVTSIGYAAFANCTGLTSVIIGNGVTSIGESVFNGCTGLTNITIPDSVTSIGEYAFRGCTGLTSVAIGNGITSIDNYAFYHCSNLTSVAIPNSVTSIGDDAFGACYKLVEVCNLSALNITKGSEDNGFVGCYAKAIYTAPYESKLSTNADGFILYTDGGVKSVIGYTGSATTLTLPVGTTEINRAAFENCTGLTSVTIPSSVTNISIGVFRGCTNLAAITVAEGNPVYHSAGNCLIETASKTLIAGCKTSVIPTDGSVTSIGENAFYRCETLANMTIPDSVTSIDGYAFCNCTGLTSITIPDSVTSIGNSAFEGCTSLTSVTIGNGVTSIDQYAFLSCTGLTNITIPDSVTSIGFAAFAHCTGLTSVIIGNGVTSIGESVFNGCTGLTNITIPDSVTSIGRNTFQGCTSLTSITIPDGVTSINIGLFSGCTSLASVTISNRVTSIDMGAFYNCTSLTSITFTGTKAQWNAISKGSYWNYSTGNYTIHCTNGNISK